MRKFGVAGLGLMLGACAFSGQVQRFGVEYNDALAEMTNEQTLLNVLRARDGMPTHFTSVSEFRGTLNLAIGGNVNGALRGEGVTDTIVSGLTATDAPTGLTTVTNESATSVITEGVDVFTPTVSGQVVSGTNFDVAVFDTQKFFQGITSGIPFSTVEGLLNQGLDNRVLALLTVARVDFRINESVGQFTKGDTVKTLFNDPVDEARALEFQAFVKCYELGSGWSGGDKVNLATVARLTRDADGKVVPLALEKLMLLDGEKFDLGPPQDGGRAFVDDPKGDSDIFLTRLSQEKRVPRLSPRELGACGFTEAADGERALPVENIVLADNTPARIVVPASPTQHAVYLGDEKAIVAIKENGITAAKIVDVTIEVTFRSPDGVFRYLGTYLGTPGSKIDVDGGRLFSIEEGRQKGALAQAMYRGKTYSLVDSSPSRRNAQIFTLLQQLVNLHKEASERPTTIPVRAIP